MKIEKLKLKNFGPFVGENEIDFSLLEDIFLIYGNTGSGKTTIFDAVCYALYGKLPGTREKQDIRKCKSDFAKAGEDAFIELCFQVKEDSFRVKRTLPYLYETKNKTIAEKPSSLVLEIKESNDTKQDARFEEDSLFQNDGNTSEWKILTDNLSEGNKKIESILGLTATEFSTIILLPQGEFAQFLKQNSQQRRESLSTLFPVEIYKNFISTVGEKTKNFSAQSANLETNLLELRKVFSPEETDKKQEIFNTKITELKEERVKLNSAVSKKTEKKIHLEQVINRKESYESYLEEEKKTKISFERLQKEKANIELIEKKLIAMDAALKEFIKTEKYIKECEEGFDEKSKLENKQSINTHKISELQKNLRGYEKKLEDLSQDKEKLVDLLEEKNKKEKELHKENEKIAEIKKRIELETTIEKLEKKTQDINKEIEILSNDTENAKNILSDFIAADEKNKEAFQASLLAEKLESGNACPVCGSKEHPQKAKPVDSLLSLEEKIQSQKNLIAVAEKNLREKERIQTANTTELSLAKENLSRIENKEDLADAIKKQTTIEEEIQGLSIKIEKKKNDEKEKERLSKEINTCKDTIIQAESERDALKMDAALLTQSIKTAESHVLQMEENYKELLKEIYQKYAIKKNEEASKQGLRLQYLSTQSMQLLKKDFDSQTAEVASYKDECTALEKKRNTLAGQIDEAKKALEKSALFISELDEIALFETKSLSLLRELLDKTLIEIESNTAKQKEIEEEIEKLQAGLSKERQYAEQYIENSQKLAALQKESEVIAHLNNLLSGNNEKKTPLDAWVLSLFLEEIIIYATKRLEKLSSGRYTFSLKTENAGGRGYKGLEIEIFDSFTGKNRPPSTLSGGETFIASISLALALTDVVQSRSGGISIDSLFIDEGFGSLDPESLELALGIIDEIRSERVVGLISHVGDLGSRINSQIIVHKSNKGSSLSLIGV